MDHPQEAAAVRRQNGASPSRRGLQETWEEFKEKANQPMEEAMAQITAPSAAGGWRPALNRFWRENRTTIFAALGATALVFVVRTILSRNDQRD